MIQGKIQYGCKSDPDNIGYEQQACEFRDLTESQYSDEYRDPQRDNYDETSSRGFQTEERYRPENVQHKLHTEGDERRLCMYAIVSFPPDKEQGDAHYDE